MSRKAADLSHLEPVHSGSSGRNCIEEDVPYNVAFITLGCAKNEVDSDRMSALIKACEEFVVIDDPDDADVIIVNTCSFLVAAVEEGLEVTLSLVEEKLREGIHCPIIMSGCIPSRYGSELVTELPEVAAFLPCDKEDDVVDVLRHVLGIARKAQAVPDVSRTIQGAVAYLKISDGCDRFCSFCAIPLIRGAYQSRPLEVLLEEATYLFEGGVRELVLIGQDTGIWGRDLSADLSLAQLMKELAHLASNYDAWIRVLYLQPEGLTPELIATIRDCDQIVKYIDLPLQHASPSVLSDMNRSGNTQEFLDLIALLRREIPDITLRTTALIGFPGETEEDFNLLVDFIRAAQFDYCSVFAFSAEDGTKAAEMPGQIDETTKHAREQIMHDVAEELGFASAARRLGSTYRVLIDSYETDESGNPDLIGRTFFQAPDSDGVVHLGDANITMGSFVDVCIDDAVCYELFGHPITQG